jgi:hypothetical protein
MPTGYTAFITEREGVTFKDFAERCTRAFGSAVMQRDEPLDAPTRHREFSFYCVERLIKAKSEFDRLRVMSFEEADKIALDEYNQAVDSDAKSNAAKDADREKYNAILIELLDWEAPTPDHADFRAFMYQQLTETIKYDCSHYDFAPKEVATGEVWLTAKIKRVREDIEQAEKDIIEEAERVFKANKWLDDLRASLEKPYKRDPAQDAKLARIAGEE